MKVYQLIEKLQRYDSDADVYIGSQPNWPFECSVAGLTSRSEFTEEDPELMAYDDADDGRPNDVLLCEGRQVRYGSKGMFNCCD